MNLSKSIEKSLIQHCSPTLASLKTASLFAVKFACGEELDGILREWNKRLSVKGITIMKLSEKSGRALIYVFRKSRLSRDLNHPRVRGFLRKNGYSATDIDSAISTLRSHLSEPDGFPHEIGIFLGYPIDDVMGFIQNKGRNCKCCGCWKVYRNEREAKRTFARFRKCEAIYMRLWRQGRSVLQLTVAA